MLNAILVYALTDEQVYQQVDILKGKGIIKSTVLKGFEIELEEIFR
ncbi:hypothetical protein NC797_17730 [Aquibacillus sp. 3ASR75-11]|uniref:Uncharacterized protein n=1 Tax=Terrihalobacillus insolitus TaxID=2950438 RepID=A0A9X4ANZ6_9BACI|nr:hypothetical protein [Terrihalobacillus insolitus]MDC3415253.1 hypothetical protein [Terrihalobacillus insolitus]MDC3426324.1 hypothetical protein [Terrihalobacillus insolitus]